MPVLCPDPSKRSEQILDYAGAGATSAQHEVAALATRRGKHELPTGPELEARWRDELAACALDPWDAAHHPEHALAVAAARGAERDHPFDPPEIPGDGPVACAASALFRHESVVTRKDLLQHAFELAGVRGLGVGVVEAELAELERDGTLLPLAAAEMVPGASACWTSPGIAACEASMLRATDRPLERGWIAPEAVAAALARNGHLSAEQAEAVRQAAGPDGVSLLQAGAGTGKTTTAAILVAAAHASGMRVIGLAPSWVAADELGRSTGIPAQAIARWRHERARAARSDAVPQADATALDRDTLVLVDEAGMVGSRDLEAILSAAQAAGAKVVLIGDRRQLAAVAGASPLRAVAEVVGRSAVLGEVRRQTVAWQRAASVVMARGDAEAGLRAYASEGQVELVAGAEAAQTRVITAWTEQRARYDDVLIVTRRNADAAALNARARAVLRAEARLGHDLIALPARDREDKLVPLALALGDHLRFGESLPHLGLRNGTRARVEALVAGPDGGARLRLALEDGRVIEAAWGELRRVPRFGRRTAHPKIVHAYAGTAYAAQGRTCSAAVVYLGAGTDAREVYVGLTRHRHEARVVIERDRLDALCRQRQVDPRMPATDTMVLERLFQEARSYREKANVVDYAADRIAFVRDGVLGPPERGAPGIDVGRAVRAARALREAAAWLGVERLVVPPWRLIDAYGRRLGRAPALAVRRLVAQLAHHLGRPVPERGRERGIER